MKPAPFYALVATLMLGLLWLPRLLSPPALPGPPWTEVWASLGVGLLLGLHALVLRQRSRKGGPRR